MRSSYQTLYQGKRDNTNRIPANLKYILFIPGGYAASNARIASRLYQRLKKQCPFIAQSWKLSMQNNEVGARVVQTHEGMLSDKDFGVPHNQKFSSGPV